MAYLGPAIMMVLTVVWITCLEITDRVQTRRRDEQREEQEKKLEEELHKLRVQIIREEMDKVERKLNSVRAVDLRAPTFKEMGFDLTSRMVERSKSPPAHTSLESSSPPQDSRDLIF